MCFNERKGLVFRRYLVLLGSFNVHHKGTKADESLFRASENIKWTFFFDGVLFISKTEAETA